MVLASEARAESAWWAMGWAGLAREGNAVDQLVKVVWLAMVARVEELPAVASATAD